jgi:putative restriction endonuclease
VFIHRADSIYEDHPETQYQFPAMYLDRAARFVGDWILYYEPAKVRNSRGYFAIARVERIVPDPTKSAMHLALIEPGSYLSFERPVPFTGPEGRPERGVVNPQWAVRPVSLEDFNRILDLGIPDEAPLLPRAGTPAENPAYVEPSRDTPGLVREEQAPFQVDDAERERVGYYSSRIVRDRVFRRIVLDAYDSRCAVTGLKFINGGGRAEVEAAHIKPVETNGPDDIRNGLALSGTAHWMFDRGLISLSDDLDVLVSRQVNDVEGVWKLVNQARRAAVPGNPAHRPHPSYLAWHRERCFKR